MIVAYHRKVSNAPAALTLPVSALLLILAALALVTARRGWAGTLRRDGRLGIHSPAAVSSDEAFVLANKVAAPVVGGAATIGLALAVLLPVLPLPTAAAVVVAVLALAAVPGLLLAAGAIGETAARTIPVPARRPAATPGAGCGGCGCGSGGCAGLTRNAIPAEHG